MKRLWRRFRCHLIDEAAALFTLHGVLRNRRRPPVKGRTAEQFPELFSGDWRAFYQPAAEAVACQAAAKVRLDDDGTVIRDFWFPSPVSTGYPENDRVQFRRWKPANRDAGVTLVGVDGIVQFGCGWFHRLARCVAPAGLEVAMMDAPFNFRRTPDGHRPGQLIVGGDLDHQLSVSRQAVLDLWTLLETLKAEGRRIGLVGISFGGWLSLMTSVVATGIDFVIALVPPVDMFHILREGGTVVRAARRGLGRLSFDEEELRRISRAVSPLAWPPPASAARTILHLAEHDRFVPNRRIEELAARWGSRLVRHDDGHIGAALGQAMIDVVAREAVELARAPSA